MTISTLKGYEEFLRELKSRIRSTQVRAALAVNSELVLLYWQIGCDILLSPETPLLRGHRTESDFLQT